eukprot:CAMPEP_0197042584 /NCGR_PEP_ID=MMETSP1384-20130603/18930_1 /TAXON_ID=29189 /ORGANISM="Ammonia sp." /LENGTH=207 /DNA_ID=CAMNT_0042473721 /DNA_START=37 /DNA_END=661 /DNA_ORIENTATION=-
MAIGHGLALNVLSFETYQPIKPWMELWFKKHCVKQQVFEKIYCFMKSRVWTFGFPNNFTHGNVIAFQKKNTHLSFNANSQTVACADCKGKGTVQQKQQQNIVKNALNVMEPEGRNAFNMTATKALSGVAITKVTIMELRALTAGELEGPSIIFVMLVTATEAGTSIKQFKLRSNVKNVMEKVVTKRQRRMVLRPLQLPRKRVLKITS